MHGIGISLQSLVDTGAHGFLFLNRPVADFLVKQLSITYQPLPYPILVTGYDGKRQTRITTYLRVHLTIDGRRVYNAPFIVLDLGRHDCIIGVRFMRRFRLILDPAHNRVRWPDKYPPTPNYARDIIVKYRPTKGKPTHGRSRMTRTAAIARWRKTTIDESQELRLTKSKHDSRHPTDACTQSPRREVEPTAS